MATGQYQFGGFAIAGGDIPVHNYGSADIAAGLAVLIDATNVMTPNGSIGIVLPTASGGVAGTLGVTVTSIPAGKSGLVRMIGAATCTASGTVTAGETVMVSDTTAKLGYVKTQTTAGEQLGRALMTATDGLPVLVWLNHAKNA